MLQISIILPTYNGEKFIKEAIESVLNQTFKDWELIIINDGSTDKTPEILNQYQFKDKRIKVIHQKNMGLVKSLNKGIKITRGKYVARLDDDDIWDDSKKLEKQFKFCEKNPQYVLVGGGVIVIDETGKELFRYLKPQTDEEIRKIILFKCPFAHSSILFRKDEAEKIGFYREDLRFTEDWEFWMRLGKLGKFYNFPEYFIKYRAHQGNVMSKYGSLQILEGIKIIRFHKYNYPNYFKSLVYNYIKYFFFLLPFFQKIFKKFIIFKKKKNL